MYFKSLEAKYRLIRTTFNESIVYVQLHVISILYGETQGEMVSAAVHKGSLSYDGTFFHQKMLHNFQ